MLRARVIHVSFGAWRGEVAGWTSGMKKRPAGRAAGAMRIIDFVHNSPGCRGCQEKSDIMSDISVASAQAGFLQRRSQVDSGLRRNDGRVVCRTLSSVREPPASAPYCLPCPGSVPTTHELFRLQRPTVDRLKALVAPFKPTGMYGSGWQTM